ncbi:PAS domain-containing protein [Beggiatoa leptomitoformis]|uniref:PAS domain S-box protein n=1 Tax=Beggiatoa leptomitoformis TaxID=288004 RepID=A0A2N9YBL5_9GAMM|nr:PAS domain-containing protein [Beggiatoa leptomitoformis]ALG66787.1 PAS domain S-box protein [Beggiatoa leptomitoformis]AUI67867.1 PAS domain S-box protein [Beggiatoa leptomitoformis]
MPNKEFHHANFFTTCKTLLCVIGFDGGLRQFNLAWETELHYSTKELSEFLYLDLIHPEDKSITKNYIDKLITGAESAVFTNRILQKSGYYRAYLWHITACLKEFSFYAVGIETTEEVARQEIAQPMSATNTIDNQYASLFDVAPLLIVHKDKENRIIRANQQAARFWKTTTDKLSGISMDTLMPEDVDHHHADDLDIVVSGQAKRGILQETLNGTLQIDKFPYRNANGNIDGVVWFAVDITERLKVEQALRENQSLLTAIFEVAEIGIGLTDKNGRFVRVNPAYCEMFGYHPNELLGQSLLAVFPNSLHKEVQKLYQDAVSGSQFLAHDEWEGRHKDGHHFDMEITVSRLTQYNKPFVVTLTSDITQRKQMVRSLQNSEAHLRMIVENLPIMVDAMDEKYNFVLWNRECERITGYTANEMLHNPQALEKIYPNVDDRQKLVEALSNVLHTNPGYRRREWQMTCKDGTQKIIAWSINSKIKIPGFAVWGIGEDVTEREKALQQLQRSEESLRESEAHLKFVIENLPIMVNAVNAENQFVLWNRECERITGYSAAEIIGNPDALTLLYPDADYRQKMLAHFQFILEQNPGIHYSEWTVVCHDGIQKTISWAVNSKIKIPGFAVWSIGEDVSEREEALHILKTSEERLKQSEVHLKFVIEHLPTMVDALDTKGNFLLWNQECEQVTGYSAKEMIGNARGLEKLYPDPQYRQKMLDAVQRVAKEDPGYRRGEWVVRCKDGSDKNIVWSVNSKIKIPGFPVWGTGEDVTERQKILKQLADNESRLRSLVENIPIMLMAFDEKGQIVLWNRQCEQVTGFPAEDIVGNPSALAMLYPQPEYRSYRTKPLQYISPYWQNDMTCKDSKLKTIAWKDVSNQFPMSGWAKWITGEDVTFRKKIEQSMGINDGLLIAALNSIDSAVCATNSLEKIVYVNQGFCDLFGYTTEELLKMSIKQIMPSDSRGSFVARHYFSFYTGAHGSFYEETHHAFHHDGHIFKVKLNAHRVKQEKEVHILWIVNYLDG